MNIAVMRIGAPAAKIPRGEMISDIRSLLAVRAPDYQRHRTTVAGFAGSTASNALPCTILRWVCASLCAHPPTGCLACGSLNRCAAARPVTPKPATNRQLED